MNRTLLEELCRCMAFHAVESESTSKFMTPPDVEVETQVAKAKRLIAEVGFDFDELYPVSDRHVVSGTGRHPRRGIEALGKYSQIRMPFSLTTTRMTTGSPIAR